MMMLAEPNPDVSVVMPAHNEAENLPEMVDQIIAALAAADMSFEIVLIDDHSTDATPQVIEELTSQCPVLVAGRLARRSGQSAALSAGFDLARGRVIVTIDADLQNDPADIPRLIDAVSKYDVAIGWRRNRRDPWSKRIVSKFANGVRNWLTHETVRDTGCGLKAFKRECLERIARFDGMHRFLPTLVKMQGYRVVEVPVNHRPRTRGRTHYNLFNRSIGPMADLLAVRWLQKRTLRYQFEEDPAVVRY
jgi:glycosyltransferase involved in cell wall biosynthesis